MQPKDQKAAQNDINFDAIENTIKKTGSTANEKMHLIDLRFNVGEVVQYGNAGAKKHAIKIAPRQYVDLITRESISEKSLAPYLISPTLSKAVTFGEVTKHLDNKNIKSIMKPVEKTTMIDFESAITENSKLKSYQLFSTGLVDMKDGGKVLKGREFFFADVFDHIVSDKKNLSDMGYGAYSSMSTNVKAGYFKQFNKLANQKSISMTGINNIDDLVTKNKNTLKKLLSHVNTAEMTRDNPSATMIKAGRNLGTRSLDIKSGLTRVDKMAGELQSNYGMSPRGAMSSSTMAAFNPGVEKKALNLIFNEQAKDLSILDLRGNQLLTNAVTMPHLTGDLSTTFGPQLNDISHRLNMTKAQDAAFRESMHSGISGLYSKATSAEDFESILRYSLGHDRKLTFRPTTHNAMEDSARQLSLLKMNQEFMERSIKESLHPELRFQSVRARMQSGYIAHLATNAKLDNNTFFTKQNYSVWKNAKGNILNEVTETINMKKLQSQIQARMERSMGQRIEKNILESNIRQFGGSTVGFVLAGSMLFAGVRSAVDKAKRRLSEGKEKRMEGLGHESILTNIRRLSLTDFGSGFLGNVGSPAMMKMMKSLFVRHVTRPESMHAQIKTSLSTIATNIKRTAKKDSIWDSVKETLTNRRAFTDTSRMLFNTSYGRPTGTIPSMIENLIPSGSVQNTLLKGVKHTEYLASLYAQTLGKAPKPGSASKRISSEISSHISKLFSTGGKNPKLRAPAIALGLGGIGALGIILSRGKYDENKMYEPMPNKQETKYNRKAEHWGKVRQSVRDIRNSNREGLELGSRQREGMRYRNTDFGSGYRYAKLTMLKHVKLGTRVFAEGTRKISTILSKNLKTSYSTGKQVNRNIAQKSARSDNMIMNTVRKMKRRPISKNKQTLTSHFGGSARKQTQPQTQISKIKQQISREQAIEPIRKAKAKYVKTLYRKSKSKPISYKRSNFNTKLTSYRGQQKIRGIGNIKSPRYPIQKQPRKFNDIGKLGSKNNITAKSIANKEKSPNFLRPPAAEQYKSNYALKASQKKVNIDLQQKHNRWREIAESRRKEYVSPPPMYKPTVKNYNTQEILNPTRSNITGTAPAPGEFMSNTKVRNLAGQTRVKEKIAYSGMHRSIKEPQFIPNQGRDRSIEFLKDSSRRDMLAEFGPNISNAKHTSTDMLYHSDSISSALLKIGNKKKYAQYGSLALPNI